MFLGAVVALALGAVPATQIQTQQSGDAAKQASAPREQEGRTGPAIPADQVLQKKPAQPAQGSATSQAKADCAVKANSCEGRCGAGQTGDELSCKSKCKKAELSCANQARSKSKAQGRAPSHTSTSHQQPAPDSPE